jgi:hypothetical protein
MQNGIVVITLGAFVLGQAVEQTLPQVGGVIQGGALAFLAGLYYVQRKEQREDRKELVAAIREQTASLTLLRENCAAVNAGK